MGPLTPSQHSLGPGRPLQPTEPWRRSHFGREAGRLLRPLLGALRPAQPQRVAPLTYWPLPAMEAGGWYGPCCSILSKAIHATIDPPTPSWVETYGSGSRPRPTERRFGRRKKWEEEEGEPYVNRWSNWYEDIRTRAGYITKLLAIGKMAAGGEDEKGGENECRQHLAQVHPIICLPWWGLTEQTKPFEVSDLNGNLSTKYLLGFPTHFSTISCSFQIHTSEWYLSDFSPGFNVHKVFFTTFDRGCIQTFKNSYLAAHGIPGLTSKGPPWPSHHLPRLWLNFNNFLTFNSLTEPLSTKAQRWNWI